MGDRYFKKWSPIIRDLIFYHHLSSSIFYIYNRKLTFCDYLTSSTLNYVVCDKDRCVRKLQGHVNEAFFLYNEEEDWRLDRSLHSLMVNATDAIGNLACNMYADHPEWQGDMFDNNFCVSRSSCVNVNGYREGESRPVFLCIRNWLRTHEEAQVMLASILVVVGLWWLVRAVLTLLINLVCPLLVVILAVVCVPQLRAPLLGQNYPLLANLLRKILLKLADNIASC